MLAGHGHSYDGKTERELEGELEIEKNTRIYTLAEKDIEYYG